MNQFDRMIVSDLDGTLFFPEHGIHQDEIDTFKALGDKRVLRVVATGRSWAGTRKTLPLDFPIDYLVFSSGAGIVDWKTQELLVCHNLTPEQVSRATTVFMQQELDFMIHDPIPENHRFRFHRTDKPNTDFDRRLQLHWNNGMPLSPKAVGDHASQLLAIHPGGDPTQPYEALRAALPDFSIVRATSPLDGKSFWLEAFSANVSKSQGAQWLADKIGLSAPAVLAVGNDYNDWDLLRWAGTARIMDNAPTVLREEFENIPCADRVGVTQAVNEWLIK